jgi:hypothetical protein
VLHGNCTTLKAAQRFTIGYYRLSHFWIAGLTLLKLRSLVSFPQCCLTAEGLRQTGATHSLRHMEDKNPTTERNKKSRTSLCPPGQAHAAATNVAPRAAVVLPSEVSIRDGLPASTFELVGIVLWNCQQRDFCWANCHRIRWCYLTAACLI